MSSKISAVVESSAAASSAAGKESTPLSREAMIARALDVADTDGLAAVSIRRIAQDFGVTPMALYWHVKNKDELLAAMGDAIIGEVPVPTPSPAPELDELRPLLMSLVEVLSRHPGSTALAMARILQCENGQAMTEMALTILQDNGFTVQESANLARAALQTTIMLVSGRPGAETTVKQEERAAVLAHKRAALAGLPADRFPRLVESADALTECDDEAAYYGAGIDLFMAGVTALRANR
jgi:AcrR family transcriptional regulator